MMPSSPRSLPEAHGHQCSLHFHHNLEWTPPETDGKSNPSLSHTGWSNHVNARELQYSDSSESHWMPTWRSCNVDSRTVSQHGPPSSTLQIPLVNERILSHNTSMATTAISPILSNRSARRKCKATTETLAATASRRTKTRTTAAFSSRRRNLHEAPQIPSLSSSIRSNRIYVRIKRLVKDKVRTPRSYQHGDERDRARFGPSILVPGVQMQIINHYHHHHSELNHGLPSSASDSGWNPNIKRNRNATSETVIMGHNHPAGKADANSNVRFTRHRSDEKSLFNMPSLHDYGSNRNGNGFPHLPKHSRPIEKFVMTQRLLNLDMGPIAWRCIEELSNPPEPFVWYLAHVLTEAVQVFLEHNTGKEYWIKHVSFWSEILDPGSHWWKTTEGSVYKDIVRKLYASHRRRSGGSDFMECLGDKRAQNLLVRACIMFATESSSNGS